MKLSYFRPISEYKEKCYLEKRKACKRFYESDGKMIVNQRRNF